MADTTYKESTIRLMTRLAIKHDAVNLSQGFPNEPPSYELVWGATAAMHSGTPEDAERFESLTMADLLAEGESAEEFLKLDLKAVLARSRNPHHRDEFNQYSFPMGMRELRQQISEYTEQLYGFAPHVDDEITVVLGATEGFATSLRALLEPGDGVAFFQPYHELYTSQISLFNLKAHFMTLKEDRATGVWNFDRAEVEATLRTAGVKALLFNTPHNPTGKVFTRDEVEILAKLCKECGILVITDEIYEHIVYEDSADKHICMRTIEGMADSTVIIQSLSKTASATGWRVGWIISPKVWTTRVRAVHDSLVIQAPTPLQKGAQRLLAAGAGQFADLAAKYREKRDLLCAALRAVGFELSPPKGAYYVMADYRNVKAIASLPPKEAAMFLIEKIGVASVPGDNFYGEGDDGNVYLRFAFCRAIGTLKSAAERLAVLPTLDIGRLDDGMALPAAALAAAPTKAGGQQDKEKVAAIAAYTVEQVCAFLLEGGLSQKTAQLFRQNEMDGAEIMEVLEDEGHGLSVDMKLRFSVTGLDSDRAALAQCTQLLESSPLCKCE